MIEREESDWGVSLVVRPFAGAKEGAAMEIRADVLLPKLPRNSEIRVSFTGVSYTAPLKLMDAQVWSEAMKAILAEARSVAADLKSGGGKSNKKRK